MYVQMRLRGSAGVASEGQQLTGRYTMVQIYSDAASLKMRQHYKGAVVEPDDQIVAPVV
jgi:hypothetical protein